MCLTRKLSVLIGVITGLWLLLLIKAGYHFVPYHVKSSNIHVSCPYSNLFVRQEHLFASGLNTHSKSTYFEPLYCRLL